MQNRYIVLMAAAGCISASSIRSRLDKLDKITDMAVIIRESQDCKQPVKPSKCGLAEVCLARSLFAAASCKHANDQAATKQPIDVQLISDKACKSDLDIAEDVCNKMKESAHADMGSNKSSIDSGLPRDLGSKSDASTRTETRD